VSLGLVIGGSLVWVFSVFHVALFEHALSFIVIFLVVAIGFAVMLSPLVPRPVARLVCAGGRWLVRLGSTVLLLLVRGVIWAIRGSVAHTVLSPHRQAEAWQGRRARQAGKRARGAVPEMAGGHGVLGAAIQGDLAWCVGKWLVLPELELQKHGVVIGGSGSGKTITLLRLAFLAAKCYGYRVFFVDAKADKPTAALFAAMMAESAGVNVHLFPAGSFDGWRGDGRAILNRLMALESFSEPYYKAVTKTVLDALCNRPEGPPRSAQAFFERFAGLEDQVKLTKAELAGVELRYRAFFDVLDGLLDGGWSWEDTEAAYFLLDGLALKEEAASLGRFLIEDFAHYACQRKRRGKDLLILDEYSALSAGGTDAANLVERLRSYGCAVILASQSYAGLGRPEDAERILDAANWLIVHRNAAPERLTRRAGTKRVIRESYRFGGKMHEHLAHRGEMRLEEEPAVHPDQARRLETGEAIIIAHGHSAQVRIVQPPMPRQADRDEVWVRMGPPPTSPSATPECEPDQLQRLQGGMTPSGGDMGEAAAPSAIPIDQVQTSQNNDQDEIERL
jgi:hypothetical protein